jgi:hypothetical protein
MNRKQRDRYKLYVIIQVAAEEAGLSWDDMYALVMKRLEELDSDGR